MHTLETLFQQYTGRKPDHIEELLASGSNRKYFRITGGDVVVIGVEGTSIKENQAFIAMSHHFRNKALPVPQVLVQSDDSRFYLQEDLGDVVLFDFIAEGRKTGVFSENEKEMLRKTLRLLPVFQVKGAEGLDFSVCYPQPEFNARTISWDLNYFKYCFLKATGIEFLEGKLESDFQNLSDVLLRTPSDAFMYRDFQSRNVMIKDGQPYFIDFQGGRRGPLHYDVASFLWQARANFSDELRAELLEEYISALKELREIDADEFRKQLKHFVLFRTLQVLGAYGFRGYFEKKPHFLQSIPFALKNLRQLLHEDMSAYPYLAEILQQLCDLEQFQESVPSQHLVVKVYSFSYRKGVPHDDSGNGGGFVFDCRALHNPGRYAQYAKLTGLDQPVIDFLEEDGEVQPFLEQAYQLVDASVQRYKERGFTSLMVSFGCTGGQHRSVYAAQKMAEHIHRKFGVEVQLIHREQKIQTTFSS
ncbi:MAG: RapZ C-terminal domain-containing protein [Paludibacter sp.]|jgi:aminoglycoside/choline kinase family phosphotransferase|nr:RNase adapter RapZ [Paludibacter sp.]HOS45462.1 RNase adapter RapZ [Paludibacter sp.]HPM10085.1 RNase adapter RapZ [Paludibacter sp.]